MSEAMLDYAALREALQGRFESRMGLPAPAYADPRVFAEERRRLFARRWVAVGYEDDAPAPGDVAPLTAPSGHPLVLARDRAGELRLFHNVCRHRGLCVVREAHNARTIACPYHAWTYGLDGRLQHAPHYHGFDEHGGEEVARHVGGLEPVRIGRWCKVVFADLSGEAEPFDEFIGPLAREWEWLGLDDLAHGHSFEYELDANWKLVCENFVDIYHVPYVHPALNRYNSKMRDNALIEIGADFVGTSTEGYRPADEAADRLPKHAGVTDARRGFLHSMAVFPNLLVALFDDNLRTIIAHPVDHRRTHERVEVYFAPAAMTPELDAMRRITAERFPAFNVEDIDLCEDLQRSMERSAFDGGYFSPRYDETVRRFQTRYCEAMQ